jgi:hypothetical protein
MISAKLTPDNALARFCWHRTRADRMAKKRVAPLERAFLGHAQACPNSCRVGRLSDEPLTRRYTFDARAVVLAAGTRAPVAWRIGSRYPGNLFNACCRNGQSTICFIPIPWRNTLYHGSGLSGESCPMTSTMAGKWRRCSFFKTSTPSN